MLDPTSEKQGHWWHSAVAGIPSLGGRPKRHLSPGASRRPQPPTAAHTAGGGGGGGWASAPSFMRNHLLEVASWDLENICSL